MMVRVDMSNRCSPQATGTPDCPGILPGSLGGHRTSAPSNRGLGCWELAGSYNNVHFSDWRLEAQD